MKLYRQHRLEEVEDEFIANVDNVNFPLEEEALQSGKRRNGVLSLDSQRVLQGILNELDTFYLLEENGERFTFWIRQQGLSHPPVIYQGSAHQIHIRF